MANALIELREVDVALNGRPVLRDLTWSLHRGEHWSINGANGSGKSTFLRLLRGELWPAPGKGERVYRLGGGEQHTAVGIKEQVALVSPESQHRYLQQEWQRTARDVICTGFTQTDYNYVKLRPEERQAAEQLAARLRIEPLLRRDVQTLSTGELRKVLIARALVGHPRILLLDEVCDGLDAAFRRDMLSFIDSIARHGTQVIYTTHRHDEQLPAITHELFFESGRMTRQGRVTRRSQPASRKDILRPGRPVFSANPPLVQGDAAPLISVSGADVYLGRKKVLRGVEWQLRPGEHWVVLGGNGAGKTTFLKLVASEVYPAVGARVERFGLNPQNTIWDLRRRIGCVSPLLQTHYSEAIKAEQVVASGFFSSIGLMDKVSPEQQQRVDTLLAEFRTTALAGKRMQELSFGELRKVLMLRALVHQPQLLIFDEPFDGLDRPSRREFAETLDAVAAQGTQLLIVTHHLDDLPRAINRGLFLERGAVAVSGPWPEIRTDRQVLRLFGSDEDRGADAGRRVDRPVSRPLH